MDMLIQLAPNLFNNQAAPILHTCRKCNALITKLEWAWDQEIMSKPLQGRFLVKIDETQDRETAEPLIKLFFFGSLHLFFSQLEADIRGLGPQKPIHVGISDSELGPVWTDQNLDAS